MIKNLTINTAEAFIIDDAFKSNDGDTVFRDYRNILIMVGRCIASSKDVTLGLNEQELWDLRARIRMAVGVGNQTGADLLCRIYELILECEQARMLGNAVLLTQEQIDEIDAEIAELAWIDTEVKHARERENEDYSEDYAENDS